MGEITAAVEVGAIERELDGVDHRLARHQPNHGQQRLRAQAVTPLEDFEPHRRPPPLGCECQCGEPTFVLAVRLPDGRADDDLEDLVLAEACGTDGGDVVVGHVVRVVGHLLDQRAHRFTETGIVERGPAQLGGRLPAAAEDAGDELAMQLGYVSHRW